MGNQWVAVALRLLVATMLLLGIFTDAAPNYLCRRQADQAGQPCSTLLKVLREPLGYSSWNRNTFAKAINQLHAYQELFQGRMPSFVKLGNWRVGQIRALSAMVAGSGNHGGRQHHHDKKLYGGREDASKAAAHQHEGEYWRPHEPTTVVAARNAPTEGAPSKNESKKSAASGGRKPRRSLWQRALRSIDKLWHKMPQPVRRSGCFIKRGYVKCRELLESAGVLTPATTTKVVPIELRVQERHLELEPLCCLSSCLVRGGCMAVMAFELFYALVILIYAFDRMWHEGRFQLWRPLQFNVQSILAHHIFLYLLLTIAIVTVVMCLLLLRGLLRYNKKLMFLHWRFNHFLLGFNFLAALLFALALASEGLAAWTFMNVLLLLNFVLQLPIQLWAISVVKSCADFFSLIQVFLTLAEK